jgi:uncharacterized phage protein gp47/JayE
MATFGLTPDGLLIKSFSDILSELELAYRSDFGDEANLDPQTSLDGKIINSYAERESLIWQLIQAVHDSAYPDSADGISLDGAVDLTGIERLPSTFSTVPATITGTPGSFGAVGRIFEVEGTGERFETVADTTIGGGGTVDVECIAQNSGAVQANAGTLNIIVTPVTGWDSVVNSSDAEQGEPIEIDAALRLRRRQSLQVVGAAAVDAIRSRLINDVDGVVDAFVFENESNLPDADGRPPKSIHCVVAGGTAIDIANKIWQVKAGGIETAGVAVDGSIATITSFADAGAGCVTVTTSAPHGFSDGEIAVIEGTTNYNDGFFISNASGSVFDIIHSWDGDDATGTAKVPTADESEIITDTSGTNHTIEFDRATEVSVWMHIQISVGTEFVQGSKQQDVVEIVAAADNEDYTVTINGINFTIDSGGGATKNSIAAALISAINNTAANGWVPVTASPSGPPDEFVNLQSDYNGNPFTVTVTADTPANITVVAGSHVDGSGDQAAVIDNVVDFAEGTELIPKEQVIGKDVYLSRYWSPINIVDDIQSISITVADSTQPDTVPPGGGDWSTSDVSINSTEVADLDTLRVTVELV